MALTEIYVNPAIAADSGTGTIGDPFGDLEYAIEQTTFDTTNGTRVNIQAGTDEVLAAQLATAMADTGTTVAWAPSASAPCVFQGYTSAAGDGGIGGISGGGSVPVIDGSAFDYVVFRDLHLHNCGTGDIIDIDNNCSVINCELDNADGYAIRLDTSSIVIGCYIHNMGNRGIDVASGFIGYNYISNVGIKTMNVAIDPGGAATIYRNIIDIDGATDGIDSFTGCVVTHNSIYSNGGTGSGITCVNSAAQCVIDNNVIEGFSGSGGVGIDFGTGALVNSYRGNAVYNCATAYDATVTTHIEGSNETLSASPFTDAANGDFSPVDTGSVSEGSLPQIIGGGLV